MRTHSKMAAIEAAGEHRMDGLQDDSPTTNLWSVKSQTGQLVQ